ncbi:MAG: GT2 family glycosyltransferase [Rhodothermales bacterium]|jgi:GT2 family glycosyltransferase
MNALVAIVHYQTPDLLEQAVTSFRAVDPETPLLVVDNGSSDGSQEFVLSLPQRFAGVRARMLSANIFHGPAMDLVMQEASEDLVFFLDSDTITHRGGFLKPLAALALQNDVLAAGQVAYVDKRGFATETGTPVPVSAFMMINTRQYLNLPPFEHHGLPVLKTCAEAARRGLSVKEFPVEEYVEHLGRGTAARFGYGLGLKSRMSFLLHKLGL